jgi:hypothetical protein
MDERDVTGVGRDQGTNNGTTGGSSSYNHNNSTSSSEVITNKSSGSSVNDPSQVSNPSEQITVWPGKESKTNQSEPPTALKDTIAISKTIYRIHPHLDTFGCNNCNLRDKWEMQEHVRRRF